MPVEYYRTRDPIENFKLRVCIREVSVMSCEVFR